MSPLGKDSIMPQYDIGPDGVEVEVNGDVQDMYTDAQLVAHVKAEAERQEGSGLSLDEAVKKAHERGINLREIADSAGWSQDAVKKVVKPASASAST